MFCIHALPIGIKLIASFITLDNRSQYLLYIYTVEARHNRYTLQWDRITREIFLEHNFLILKIACYLVIMDSHSKIALLAIMEFLMNQSISQSVAL